MHAWIRLALLLALSPSTALAAGPGDLPARFVAAWNAHDLKAFEALYTPDAVWVPVAEERTEGRVAIISEFAKIHDAGGWAAKTTIRLRNVPEVHLLRPDVATIFFHMDFLADGRAVPGLQRAMILVATSSKGEWRVAAGQLTKESAAAAK